MRNSIKIVGCFIWLLFFHCEDSLFAQGNLAGARPRTLIGKKYNNERVLPGLPGYEYREVSLATGEEEPEQLEVGVFQKGSTWLVFFGVNTDTTTDVYTILDVLIIKHVQPTQSIKTLLCRQDRISNIEIVALIQPGKEEYAPALKAWRFNREKKRFEVISTRKIDCLNEGRE